MSQFKIRKLISLMFLGLCLQISQVRGQIPTEIEAQQKELELQWHAQFWTYLESSEYPQFRIRAAIRLIRTGEPQAIEQGEQLINEVLDEPGLDPASLWLLASDCQRSESAEWCQPGGVYEFLTQADPHNAAVTMLRFSQTSYKEDDLLDTEANRQLLFKAAQADHFDSYWGRGADKLFEEALQFVDMHPWPVLPEFENEAQRFGLTISKDKAAYYGPMSLLVSSPVVGYDNMTELCRQQVSNQHPDGIEACKNLARILREASNTMLSRIIGYGLEKTMLKTLNPDDSGIRRWQNRRNIFSVMQSCFLPYWQLNLELLSEESNASMMQWAKNVSELGEWEGTRLSAFQDYKTSPEHIAVSPVDCDKLNDLDDEALEKLFNNQGPGEVWRSMQEGARNSGN